MTRRGEPGHQERNPKRDEEQEPEGTVPGNSNHWFLFILLERVVYSHTFLSLRQAPLSARYRDYGGNRAIGHVARATTVLDSARGGGVTMTNAARKGSPVSRGEEASSIFRRRPNMSPTPPADGVHALVRAGADVPRRAQAARHLRDHSRHAHLPPGIRLLLPGAVERTGHAAGRALRRILRVRPAGRPRAGGAGLVRGGIPSLLRGQGARRPRRARGGAGLRRAGTCSSSRAAATASCPSISTIP